MTRFLLVDDHEMVRRGLGLMLTQAFAGSTMVEAGTAAQARARLQEGPVDLVLLDINLGGQSGLDLLGELRRQHADTPVLMVSAFPEEEFAVRCLRLGAAGYLSKAAASDELLAAVRKVLSGGRYVTAALAERLASLVGQPDPSSPHDALSSRELQVLRLVASGRSLKQIAEDLSLSEKTIATYRARIATKLGLSTNVALTRYAMTHRLVE